MADVTYTPVGWEDSPSTNTPINESNLGNMEIGIVDTVNRANESIPFANIIPVEDAGAITEEGKYVGDAIDVYKAYSQSISTYTHTYDEDTDVHTLAGSGANGKFIATAGFITGDTFAINGETVTAILPKGVSLSTGCFVSGAVVEFAVTENGITVFVEDLEQFITETALRTLSVSSGLQNIEFANSLFTGVDFDAYEPFAMASSRTLLSSLGITGSILHTSGTTAVTVKVLNTATAAIYGDVYVTLMFKRK